MLVKLSLLTICSTLLLSVNAQSNCPDTSTVCSSNLCDENTRCPRFYNAECTVNSCNGVCTPNFFFRGRNVTDRCGTVTCDTRDCPGNRQCMEEVTPSLCPTQRSCRQRLRVRCVARPRPMSCEDVDCGEGMTCWMRDRRNRPPVVRCIPAPPTNAPPTTTTEQTTTLPSTEPTTLPITTVITPLTTRTTPTPTPTSPPASCQDLDCVAGQECIEFPTDGSFTFVSGPTCLGIIRLSCEDLSCPTNETCLTQMLPAADLALSACVQESILEILNDSFTCNESSCVGEDSGCIVSMHPSIVTSSICLNIGFNQAVQIVNFILDSLTSPPDTTATIPTATTNTPFTTPFTVGVSTSQPPTTTPPPTSLPTSCQDISCGPESECIEFPTDASLGIFSGPTCFTVIRMSCEDLSCPAGSVCLTQTLLEADLTIAICAPESFLQSVNGSFTCNESSCPGEDSGCVVLTHPSIMTGSICLSGGINQSVLLVNFILSQLSVTTSPPDTTATTPMAATTDTPFTTPFTIGVSTSQPPTSTPPPTSPPTSCANVSCGPGLECIEFPSNIGGAMCLPGVALNCGSLSCPSGQECAVQSLPEENISIGICTQSVIFSVLESSTCDSLSCDGEDVGCAEIMGSNGTIAFCLPGFSNTILIGRHLLMVLTDQAASTTSPPFTSPVSTLPPSTSAPVTNIFSTFPTTPSVTTESPLCSMDCSSVGQQCVGISADGTAGGSAVGVCLPIIGLSCEDITCPNVPEEQSCILQSFVERDLSIAQCLPASSLNSTLFQTTSCAVVQCEQGSECIDLRIGDMQIMGICIQTDCTNNTLCDTESGNVCSLVPPEFGLNFTSLCVPSFIQSQFGTQTCEMIGRTCPSPLVCQDAYSSDELIGTFCNVNPFPSSCDEITCSANEECVVTTSAVSTLASCVANVEAILPTIQQLLELLGLVDSSNTDSPPTTPSGTELSTTLSTIAPPTMAPVCSFNCSSIGLVCGNQDGFPTCVQPSTCTDELSAFCSQRSLVCQESDGQGLCVQPSSCNQLVCPSQQQCFELPPSVTGLNATIASCTFPVGRTCEEAMCNSTTECVTVQLSPARNLSLAQCFPAENLGAFSLSTCDTLECTGGSVCVDLERGGLPVMGSGCLVSGCAGNNTCPTGTVCTAIPSKFGLQVDSVCVPSSVNPLVGKQTCAESGRICPTSQVCQEALIDGTLVGTSCGPRSSVVTSTCQDSLCDEGEECILNTLEGSNSGLQTCLPTEILNQIAMFIKFFLTN